MLKRVDSCLNAIDALLQPRISSIEASRAPVISMELLDGTADTVHPEVRAHINSLVSAVSFRP